MNLPQQDSAVGRSLKTLVQSVSGFIIGLLIVVWTIPGVPQAVTQYTYNHIFEVLVMAGVPSAAISLVWNLLRKDVKNY